MMRLLMNGSRYSPTNIDINDSPEEVERKMNEFEDKMKQLAESAPDNYKHGKGGDKHSVPCGREP